jgi:hypothetical protein
MEAIQDTTIIYDSYGQLNKAGTVCVLPRLYLSYEASF